MSENWFPSDTESGAVLLMGCGVTVIAMLSLLAFDMTTAALFTLNIALICVLVYKSIYRPMTWAKDLGPSDEINGRATAREMFGKEISPIGTVHKLNPRAFAAKMVKNHRASLCHRYIDDVYPSYDRPRGENDIRTMKSLLYAPHNVPPVMILTKKEGNVSTCILLDGAHRVAAAYLSNSTIHYRLYELVE